MVNDFHTLIGVNAFVWNFSQVTGRIHLYISLGICNLSPACARLNAKPYLHELSGLMGPHSRIFPHNSQFLPLMPLLPPPDFNKVLSLDFASVIAESKLEISLKLRRNIRPTAGIQLVTIQSIAGMAYRA
jgi:hypothetical protein